MDIPEEVVVMIVAVLTEVDKEIVRIIAFLAHARELLVGCQVVPQFLGGLFADLQRDIDRALDYLCGLREPFQPFLTGVGETNQLSRTEP